jgi:hypothetical protein
MKRIKIVSGGQTGVDRAALDVAMELGLECGGWCPKGRLAEDGVIPHHYPLRETKTASSAERTGKNVEDSDGTLIITRGEPTGGTALTVRIAEELQKPLLVLDLDSDPSSLAVREWISVHNIQTLNVAGPRASGCDGIYADAAVFLREVLSGGHGCSPH